MTRSSRSQLELPFHPRGGFRKNAGRPRLSDETVPHSKRPSLEGRHPVHVTLHAIGGLRSMGRGDAYRMLRQAFRAGRERFGFRLVHYAVLSNHLHFLVEAEDARALARGM